MHLKEVLSNLVQWDNFLGGKPHYGCLVQVLMSKLRAEKKEKGLRQG